MGIQLSRVQKAILLACFPMRGVVDRARFGRRAERTMTRAKDPMDGMTKVLERLIARGLLIGMGTRTRSRWYITHVRLTVEGRTVARRLVGTQQQLPMRSRK